MAIAFRAANSGNASTPNTTTGISLTKPTGTQQGDVILVQIDTFGSAASLFSAPDGTWTKRFDNQAAQHRQFVFTKVAGASEPASYTFLPAATASDTCYSIVAYSGVDTASPVGDLQSTTTSTANQTTLTFPAATAPVANCLILRMIFAIAGSTATPNTTPPTGYTERYDQRSTSTNYQSVEVSDAAQTAAGSVPSVSATISPSSQQLAQITMVLQPPLGTYPDTVLADTPFAYWRLQETSGTAYADSSGNGRGGTITGGSVTWGQPGPFTSDTSVTSVKFPLPNSGASGNTNASFTFNNDIASFECWFKRPNTTTAQGLMAANVTNGTSLSLTTGGFVTLHIYASASTIVTSTTAITDTNWHHIVCTKNGSTVHLYIDGVDVTGTVTNFTLGNGTNFFFIGVAAPPTPIYATGTMAEAAVYNVALSATRVAAHYNASFPLTLPGAGGDLEGEVAI